MADTMFADQCWSAQQGIANGVFNSFADGPQGVLADSTCVNSEKSCDSPESEDGLATRRFSWTACYYVYFILFAHISSLGAGCTIERIRVGRSAARFRASANSCVHVCNYNLISVAGAQYKGTPNPCLWISRIHATIAACPMSQLSEM